MLVFIVKFIQPSFVTMGDEASVKHFCYGLKSTGCHAGAEHIML